MADYNGSGMSIGQRLRHAWNAFTGRDQQILQTQDLGPSYIARQDRVTFRRGTEHTIIASIYTRIAMDVAAIRFQHAKLDEDGRFVETIHSGLNYCLTTEANIDQSSRDFIQGIVESLCDDGIVAVVPVDTTVNPRISGSYDVKTMRIGQISQWYPEHVKVRLYNPKSGRKEDLILPKSMVAIIQNPLYNVMNSPNSTLRRLVHKLNLLDSMDELVSSGKLDLVIHLPYMTKTEMQKQQAEARRKNLEKQLAESKYGVAYMDATEKITQLNRPVENNLMNQIEYLTSMLYSQLGMTKEVFEGTADEKTMLNYFSRTIEPFASAISEEMNRKFLTKTARSQNQKIVFFRDLFKLAPISSIVSIGKEFTTSAIMSPNEVRQLIGLKPSDNPESDDLRNRNVDSNSPESTESPPEETSPIDEVLKKEDEKP